MAQEALGAFARGTPAVERLAEWEQRDGGDGQTDAQSEVMISAASQRAIDRTWRSVAPTSRRSPSSRRRRSPIMMSVVSRRSM
jgi:hypothetical protein